MSEPLALGRIGRHIILGAGTIAGSAVTLGEESAPGTAAQVLRPADTGAIAAGVPARPVKARRHDLLAFEADHLRVEGSAR
jgi:galactoside O-acetyltransferase